MTNRWMVGAVLALLLPAHALGERVDIRPWPFYTDRPGEISVVLEMDPAAVPPQAGDLRLLEDDKATAQAYRIKSFEESKRGMALLLCVDVSGSMKAKKGGDTAPLGDIKDALLGFISHLRPNDRVALWAFATHFIEVTEFTGNHEQLREGIRRLRAETTGKTRLYDSLYDAVDLFRERDDLPKRRHIIVLSDGHDETDRDEQAAKIDSVIKNALDRRVPIDAVGYGRIDSDFTKSLRGIANGSHGLFIDADPTAPASVQDAVSRIFNHLTETTLVAYFEQPDRLPELPTHEAGVEWTPAGKSRGSTYLVQAEIPRSAKMAPTTPPTRFNWFYVVLPPLLFALLVLAFLAKRGKRAEPPPPPPQPQDQVVKEETVMVMEQPPPERPPEQPPRPPSSHRDTQVGGYFPPPQPGRPSALLRGVEGPAKGQALALEGEAVMIGADRSNDLCIDDDYLSGRHARLRYGQGSLYLSDLGSSNGSFVNDRRIGEQAVSLQAGDRIRLGQSVFTLERGDD